MRITVSLLSIIIGYGYSIATSYYYIIWYINKDHILDGIGRWYRPIDLVFMVLGLFIIGCAGVLLLTRTNVARWLYNIGLGCVIIDVIICLFSSYFDVMDFFFGLILISIKIGFTALAAFLINKYWNRIIES